MWFQWVLYWTILYLWTIRYYTNGQYNAFSGFWTLMDYYLLFIMFCKIAWSETALLTVLYIIDYNIQYVYIYIYIYIYICMVEFAWGKLNLQ